MKKLPLLLLAIVFIITGCKNNKPAEYTILGDYTPYGQGPEKLVGKVQQVVEKNYWAIPDGDTFKKDNPITIKDRDSLSWTYDFEAVFDNAGDIVSCNFLDENNKSIGKYELFKENNILTSSKFTAQDTLRSYEKIKCDINGEIMEVLQYRAIVDTLVASGKFSSGVKKDTITRQWFNYKGDPSAKVFFIYNDGDQFLRREVYNTEGAFNGALEVKYNDKGKVSELVFYDKDKKATDFNYFTYEYDQKGNWIKAIVKDNKKHMVIEERTYTYFE